MGVSGEKGIIYLVCIVIIPIDVRFDVIDLDRGVLVKIDTGILSLRFFWLGEDRGLYFDP